MNRSFLQLYEQELRHVREVAADFAAEYPKIGGRLSLQKDLRDTCPDPFVERLLEGFAYLTARVQLKLESEFPTFTQGILETVFPDYLCPGPSCAITQLELDWTDKALLKAPKFPKGSQLNGLRPKEESTSCIFTTAQDVPMLPLEVAQAEYHFRNIGDLFLQRMEGLNMKEVKAALRIRLTLKGIEGQGLAKLETDTVCFYLHGEDRLPSSVLELLLTQSHGVILRDPTDHQYRRAQLLPPKFLRQAGFTEVEALLPINPLSFDGHRILKEYFLLPQRLLFLEISGIQKALVAMPGREIELIFPLKSRRDEISDFVKPELFRLNCTPVINLFRKRADRVPITRGHYEYQVIPDRTRTLDYEVYSVQSVIGYGKTSNEQKDFYPFYLHQDQAQPGATFYSVKRERRALSDQERRFGARSTYPGGEVSLSLVDSDSAPFSPELDQLATICLCTNRHLPLTFPAGIGQTDFIPENSAGIQSVRCLVNPTNPQPSFAEGRFAWRAISHLSLNYLSLLNRGDDGASALREMLRLYAPTPDTAKLIEGIVRIESKPALARSPGGGPVSFIRGIEIDLTLDELKYVGHGAFLFASAMEQFFARYVTLNSFTRLTFHTEQRGNIYTWPTRFGRVPIL